MEKYWKKDAPKWVIKQVEAEIAEKSKLLALRWPNEAYPKASFGFGGYDHEWGIVEYGEFWVSNGSSVSHVFLRAKNENEQGWKKLRFSSDGVRWGDSVVRGHFFKSEREARLHLLWSQCNEHARELSYVWRAYEACK